MPSPRNESSPDVYSSKMATQSKTALSNFRKAAREKDGLPPSPKLEDVNAENEEALNIEDQYIRNIKYGISSIDTNLPLKKFIVKQ